MTAAANQTPVAPASVTPAAPVASSSVENFSAIDARRKACGVTVSRLIADAGIDPRTWWRIKANPDSAEQRTLRRLSNALDQSQPSRPPATSQPHPVLATIRLATTLLALETGADPAAVLAQDFTVQKPLDRQWLTASHLRRAAMWLVIVELGVDRPIVARACGCSRQNVAQALQFIERRIEEEPAFAVILDRAATVINGGRS